MTMVLPSKIYNFYFTNVLKSHSWFLLKDGCKRQMWHTVERITVFHWLAVMIHFEAEIVERFLKWAQGFALLCHLIFLPKLYGGPVLVQPRHTTAGKCATGYFMFTTKQTWKKLDTAFSRVSIYEMKGSPSKKQLSWKQKRKKLLAIAQQFLERLTPSVVDRHGFDADQDTNFHYDADQIC